MPKFSIIIPLYNKAPYIQKALQSIVCQTLRDFELIIIDDGSTDGSAIIAEKYLIENHREILYKILHQQNSGVSVARNNGVAVSKGEFIAFLDADDWWEPDFLEEMDKMIAEYPDAGIYAANYVYYKPGKTHVALMLHRGYINYPVAYMQSAAMPVTSITTCMPRTVFDEMGGFPIGIKLGEDFLLWAKTAIHYKVAFCEKPLAYYNNDVPASLRATRNLHVPEHHMLFHLDSLEKEIDSLSLVNSLTPSLVHSWRQLFDQLRVNGLLQYWINDLYHDAAATELAKVDWRRQPKSQNRVYKTPIWKLKLRMNVKRVGSLFKQRIIRIFPS